MRMQQLQLSDSNLNPVGRARAFPHQNSVNVHVVQRHEFFHGLPAPILRRISSRVRQAYYAAGRPIFSRLAAGQKRSRICNLDGTGLRSEVPRQGGPLGPQGHGQGGGGEVHPPPPDGLHLPLHVRLRRPLRDVQQLDAREPQGGHDARPDRARLQLDPVEEHRERQPLGRRADHPERHGRHLPADDRQVPETAQAHHQHDRPHARSAPSRC